MTAESPEVLAKKNGEELITLDKARKLLVALFQDEKRPFFSVTFIKRTPPYAERTIARAQFGVKKHLVGGDKAYEPLEKDLLCCYDMDAEKGMGGYRSINLNTIVCMKINGQRYRVKTGG